MSHDVRTPLLLAAACLLSSAAASAQTPPPKALEITVTAPYVPSLTAPGVAAARDRIQRTPGAVEIVPAETFRETRAVTPKDMLDYVPGVFAQPKFGEDSRLSIRGSGLSRNFHLRGIRLLQDGIIPINTADGGGDFQEIDPLALRYVEVYRGANGLPFGAASLGGVVNFVTPSGHDAPALLTRAEVGSFATRRVQVAAGGSRGGWDWYLSPTLLSAAGYRDHSGGNSRRLSANLGYRVDAATETRFYLNANNINQDIPGSLTRAMALSAPKTAVPINVLNDWERNIESYRVANKTSFLLGDAEVTVGGFAFDRKLHHPIFQVLDNRYLDYGGFARAEIDGTLFGRANAVVFGGTVHAGTDDAKRFVNVGGNKGALTFDMEQRALNLDGYVENRLQVTPSLALIAGAQLAYARRETDDRFLTDGDDSAATSFTELNPKVGLLWQAAMAWQVFGNVSRSSEAPTFSELNPTAAPGFSDLDTQKAVTVELGTRGRRGGIGWDVAVYRAWIEDELQQFTVAPGMTFTQNADDTIHQGLEIAADATVLEHLLRPGGAADSLWLRVAYTYSDFRFDGDPSFGDNDLPGAPRHYLRAELLYRHPNGLYAGPNVEWVPQAYFVDNANTTKTRAYALLGARAGWDFGRGAVFVDARNLLDETYISSAHVLPAATPASALFNPGDGAALYAGVTLRW